MSWTEKDIYEHKQAQTRAYYIVSMTIVIGCTLVAGIYLFLNRPLPPAPPPKMTAESCKSLCGDSGVDKFEEENCICLKQQKIPLRCTCE